MLCLLRSVPPTPGINCSPHIRCHMPNSHHSFSIAIRCPVEVFPGVPILTPWANKRGYPIYHRKSEASQDPRVVRYGRPYSYLPFHALVQPLNGLHRGGWRIVDFYGTQALDCNLRVLLATKANAIIVQYGLPTAFHPIALSTHLRSHQIVLALSPVFRVGVLSPQSLGHPGKVRSASVVHLRPP